MAVLVCFVMVGFGMSTLVMAVMVRCVKARLGLVLYGAVSLGMAVTVRQGQLR